MCRDNVAGGESTRNSNRQITPKEWAAYYLSVRPESPTWRDHMRLFRAKRLFEVCPELSPYGGYVMLHCKNDRLHAWKYPALSPSL